MFADTEQLPVECSHGTILIQAAASDPCGRPHS
jgi:hypothetical protein